MEKMKQSHRQEKGKEKHFLVVVVSSLQLLSFKVSFSFCVLISSACLLHQELSMSSEIVKVRGRGVI